MPKYDIFNIMGSSGVDLKFTDDGFAILTMNNGENRISTPYIKKLQSALDEVERNENCKALLTTGTSKFFCNGIDLDWLSTANREEFAEANQDLCWRLMHFPIPTVAVVNGHAFGAGAILALVHDYRVMRNDRGWFSLNEVKIKMRIKQATVALIRYKISSNRGLIESITLGKRITGPEAKELGIADISTDLSNLMSSAKDLAQSALGRSGIDRNMLTIMKQDIFPRVLNSNL